MYLEDELLYIRGYSGRYIHLRHRSRQPLVKLNLYRTHTLLGLLSYAIRGNFSLSLKIELKCPGLVTLYAASHLLSYLREAIIPVYSMKTGILHNAS